MEIGESIIWRRPSEELPPLIIEALDNLKKKHGEGPFQITKIIEAPDKIDVEFVNKNGEKVVLYSRWFEEAL
mgnify:CR=1 FL=1